MATFVGSATGTNTATPPAHAVGDIFIAWAFNRSNTTAPSMPAGWTSKANGGANSCGYRVATKVAASTSETAGTWNNASGFALLVLRPDSGNSLSVGSGGTSTTGSSTTVTYGALTMDVTSGSSWVVGLAGHRSANTALQNPPTGMTNRATAVGGNYEIAGHDTAAGVTSWPSTAVAVGGATSGWISYVLEIIESSGGASGFTGSGAATGVGTGVIGASAGFTGSSVGIGALNSVMGATASFVGSGVGTGVALFVGGEGSSDLGFAGLGVGTSTATAVMGATGGFTGSGAGVGTANATIFAGAGFVGFAAGVGQASGALDSSDGSVAGFAGSGAGIGVASGVLGFTVTDSAWLPNGTTPETWTGQARTAETWGSVARQAETWGSVARTSEGWASVSATPEDWGSTVPAPPEGYAFLANEADALLVSLTGAYLIEAL